jgi:hypothetical protein
MTRKDPFLLDAEARHGELYTSEEVSRLVQITPRQLQWWDEKRIVQPAFLHKHRRYYGATEIAQLERLAALRKAGASLQSARKLLKIPNWKMVICCRKPKVIGEVLVIP